MRELVAQAEENLYRLDWPEYMAAAERLADHIVSTPGPNSIVGIVTVPRGGLILAVVLSHLLNIPYRGELLPGASEWNRLVLSRPPACAQADLLLVDDLVDTGNTIGELNWAGRTAVLLWKEGSTVRPDWYDRKIPGQWWVVFPYERRGRDR